MKTTAYTLQSAVLRLTTPRSFEPDYKAHMARLAEDERAEAVIRKAGYNPADPSALAALQSSINN
jgi:hypothetical protein